MDASMANLAVPSAIDPETSQETMDILYEVSKILNTGLDRNTLAILVGLCEAGVNPEALAAPYTFVYEYERH